MVTLIGFLLFTMSFLDLASIESPFPESGKKTVDQKLKDKPLQLTLSVREGDSELWSPFDRIAAVRIPHTPDGEPDVSRIHAETIKIKARFPSERQIVIAPHAGMNYDAMVAVMDSVRGTEATDPPIFAKNLATGNDEPVKQLFPEVVFGNLLGGG